MNICVQGLWHLGVVTTVALSEFNHAIVALDYNAETISNLRIGILPVEEPGIPELLAKASKNNRVQFTTDPKEISSCELLCLTYDTPVNENDEADVDFVIEQFRRTLPHIKNDAYVVSSAQLPAGTVRRLKEITDEFRPDNHIRFACQPENIRLGKALNSFLDAERIIIGTESGKKEDRLASLYEPFNIPLIWMRIESAEMTKHAINAYLATSITLMGEISVICEAVGADAREVALGLRSDSRIGKNAYVSPGLGFAGGTLARDVQFLKGFQNLTNSGILISSLLPSNQVHNNWVQRKLDEILKIETSMSVLFLGLTYTEDTNTLRRSVMLQLALSLSRRGNSVSYFEDPKVLLSLDFQKELTRRESPIENISEVDVVIVSKRMPWLVDSGLVETLMNQKLTILDPNGYISGELVHSTSQANYITVGVSDGR